MVVMAAATFCHHPGIALSSYALASRCRRLLWRIADWAPKNNGIKKVVTMVSRTTVRVLMLRRYLQGSLHF